jgi:hypothetical protein
MDKILSHLHPIPNAISHLSAMYHAIIAPASFRHSKRTYHVKRLCTSLIRRIFDWMIGFIYTLYIHTVRDYTQYSANAILHTFSLPLHTH